MLGKMVRKSLLKNVLINVWTLATLTMCAAMVAMFTTIYVDVGRKMSHSLRRLGANAVVHWEEESPKSMRKTGVTRDIPNWPVVDKLANAVGADVLMLRVHVGTVTDKPLVVVSTDPATLVLMTPYWAVSGKRATAPGECLVGKRLASSLNIKTGTVVTVQWTTPQMTSDLQVVGIFESGDEDEDRIFTSSLSSTEQPSLTYALLSVPGGEQGIRLLDEQLRATGSGVTVKPLRHILHGERTVLQKITLLSSLTTIVVLVLSSLGVSAATLARIVERRRELALLQALGAVRRSVVFFLLYESTVMGAVAAVAGFVLGTILAQAVVQHVFRVSITPHLVAFLAALAATLGVTLLAGGVVSRRALHIGPAIALRGE